MLKNVPFLDRQEARAGDFNNVQAIARDSFDTLITDAITGAGAPGYRGFNITKDGNTNLVIAPGRVFRADGAVFEMAARTVRSVSGILPAATKKMVAVIAYGREDDTKSETRDFLVDLESDTTEPRNVTIERGRLAIVDLVIGQESGTLPRPAVDGSLLILGWVTLGTTGIEDIDMEASTVLPSVSGNAKRLDALESWRKRLDPRINTIASDITALKKGMKGLAGSGELSNVLKDVARIKERLEIPDTASDWAADRFLTADESDMKNIDQLCLIQEGIRFSYEAQDDTSIALFNALDVNAYVTGNGLLMPAVAKKVIRLASSSGANDGKIPISQYGFQTHEMKQMTVARSRMRYGPAYNVCNNSQWWSQGTYDSATNTFTRDGETFLVTLGQNYKNGNFWDPPTEHDIMRIQQYWQDDWKDTYWVAQTIDRKVNGAQIAQTFLNSQDGWLSGLNLLVTDKGPDSDIIISICECDEAGMPDTDSLISHVVMPYASIKLAPKETYVAIPPCLLDAGKRYAILVTTLGSHKVGIVDSNEYSQGTLFYSTDGVYYQGDLTRDLWFELEFLQFKASRVEIELKALTLSGGIASMDILAGTICPKSCKVEYNVLVDSKWRPLNKVTPGILAGLPSLLRFKVIFSGTTAVQPAIELLSSRVRVWRQRTTMKHLSTKRTLATSATTSRVDLILSKYEEDRHNITVRLKKTDGTFINSSGFTDTKIDKDRFTRSFSFAMAALSAYQIEIAGTTNNALIQWHVEERVDISF